jgi:hypothetical protein
MPRPGELHFFPNLLSDPVGGVPLPPVEPRRG